MVGQFCLRNTRSCQDVTPCWVGKLTIFTMFWKNLMQNHSTLNYPKFTPGFVAGFVVLLTMSLQILVKSNREITDPFHMGEYFASFASMFNGQEIAGLINIHGALDIIPALLSYGIYGPDHYFFGTIFLYALADVLAAIIFYVLVAIFTERFASNYQAIVLIIAAMISTMLVNV